MAKSKRLNLISPADSKLGRETIMDRALAQKHGAVYVHAAAFAIDVDRVLELTDDDDRFPFGWEVLLTDLYLSELFVLHGQSMEAVLEDTVLSVLELPRPRADGRPALGAQVAFAVYCGVERGALPASLKSCFGVWKKPPLDLAEELSPLAGDLTLRARLCRHCLEVPLAPPLVQPVREALEAMLRDAAR